MSGPAGGTRDAVAIVVVNYGSHRLVDQNLSWTRDSGWPGPVIVVDNPKTRPDTAAAADLARRRGWEFVARRRNDGFGAGVNAGARRAWELGCVAVLVVNPDVTLTSSQALSLRAGIVETRHALIAPLVVGPGGRRWGGLGEVDVAGGRLRNDVAGRGPLWVSGACFVAHRDLWHTLDGFDTDYVMYWEDVDLAVRCQEAGGEVRLIEDLTVRHDVGATQSQVAGKSTLYYYYNCRNRLVFAAKRLRRRDRWRWVRTTLGDVRRVVRRGRPSGGARARLVTLTRAVPPAGAGVVAGLWWMLRHRPEAP